MRKQIMTILVVGLLLLTGCGGEQSIPSASPLPTQKSTMETLTIYSVDSDSMSLIPVVIKKQKKVYTAEYITYLVTQNLEDEDIKISNLDSDHLNDKDLIEKYVEYYYKNDVSSDDKKCVMDYFIREAGSNQMKLTLITLFISLLLI